MEGIKATEKEIKLLKEQMKEQYNDFAQIIELAASMRTVLMECRTHSLPLKLAKEIDLILREAEKFD